MQFRAFIPYAVWFVRCLWGVENSDTSKRSKYITKVRKDENAKEDLFFDSYRFFAVALFRVLSDGNRQINSHVIADWWRNISILVVGAVRWAVGIACLSRPSTLGGLTFHCAMARKWDSILAMT
jgi:hypothetical protein